MAAKAVTAFKTNRVASRPAKSAAHSGALAAADATDGNSFANTGREVVLAQTDGSSRTITFYDKNGKGTRTVTLAKEKLYAFGPFDVYNYGTTLTFKASDAGVTVAVVSLNEQKSVQVA